MDQRSTLYIAVRRTTDTFGQLSAKAKPDLLGCFGWEQPIGCDGKVGRRHEGTIEGTVTLQIPIELERGEFSRGLAGSGLEPPFRIRVAAGELDKVNRVSPTAGISDKARDELLAYRGLRTERENQTGDSARTGVKKHVKPHAFAKLDEGLTAKFKDGEQRIDDQMIVEKTPAALLCEFLPDREFANGRTTVENDQLHFQIRIEIKIGERAARTLRGKRAIYTCVSCGFGRCQSRAICNCKVRGAPSGHEREGGPC